MSRMAKLSIVILRVIVGWFFLYQGIQAVLDPEWSLGLYMKNSQFFSQFYAALLDPAILPYVSYLAKGLFLLVGACLIAGILVRTMSLAGIALMLLFYFPLLHFPYVAAVTGTYYLVDEHIIVAAVLLFLFAARAGEYFGLGTMFRFSRY